MTTRDKDLIAKILLEKIFGPLLMKEQFENPIKCGTFDFDLQEKVLKECEVRGI